MNDHRAKYGILIQVDSQGAVRALKNIERTFDKTTATIDKKGNPVITRMERTVGRAGNSMYEFTRHTDSAGKVVRETSRKVQDLNQGLFGTGDHMGMIIRKVAQWTVATGMIYGTIRALRAGVDTIADIDERMVMLTKVYQGTEQQLMRTKRQAMELSVEMGNLVGSSIDATTVWARMGREGQDLTEGLRLSLLAQNIAEIDAAEGAKLINAALLQFNKTLDEGITVLDQWNELSNRTPVTTRDLAAAVSQAGAVFSVANAEIEDLNAYTVALSASMAKSGREIGNALKTIGSYVKRQETIPKIAEIAGIAIQREGQNYLDLDNILTQLAGTWSTLTDVQKEEIAQTAAGVRRKAYFLSLMENFNLVLDAYKVQWESAGSAMEENEIRLSALRTKVTQIGAALQKFAVDTGDKGLIGLMKNAADSTRDLIESFADLPGAAQAAVPSIAVAAGVMTAYANSTVGARAGVHSVTAAFPKLNGALARHGVIMSSVNVAWRTFTFLLRGLGVGLALWGISKAVTSITHSINSQRDALRALRREREKDIMSLKAQAAQYRSHQQQYKLYDGLLSRYHELEEQGKSTREVVSQLRQVWENISEVDPQALAGINDLDAGLVRLKERAEEAAKAAVKVYQDIAKERADIELDQMFQDMDPDLRYLQREAEKILENRNISMTPDERVGFYGAYTGFVDRHEVDSAVTLTYWVQKYNGELEKNAEIREKLAGLEQPYELPPELKTGGGDAFDLDLWSELTKQTGKLRKSHDDLFESFERLTWKGSEWIKLLREQYPQAIDGLGSKIAGGVDGSSYRVSGIDDVVALIEAKEARLDQLQDEADRLGSTVTTMADLEALKEKNDLILEERDNYRQLVEVYRLLNAEIDRQEALEKQRENRVETLIGQFHKKTLTTSEYAEFSGFDGVARLVDGGQLEEARQFLEDYVIEVSDSKDASEEWIEELESVLVLIQMIDKDLGKLNRKTRLTDLERAFNRLAEDFGEAIGHALVTGFNSDGTKRAAHNLVSSLGNALGKVASDFVTTAAVSLGSFAGPLGMVVGGIVGGIFDAAADSWFGADDENFDDLADEIQENTLALRENTDAFHDFQERLINAPSSFMLPAVKGEIPQYDGGGTVNRDGMAIVHAGEVVGTPEQLASYLSPMAHQMSHSSYVNNQIQLEIAVNGAQDPSATMDEIVERVSEVYAGLQGRGAHLEGAF